MLKNLVEYVAKTLVEHPEQVRVNRQGGGDRDHAAPPCRPRGPGPSGRKTRPDRACHADRAVCGGRTPPASRGAANRGGRGRNPERLVCRRGGPGKEPNSLCFPVSSSARVPDARNPLR